MTTLEEAEAEQWCIDNGHIPDPLAWGEWKEQFCFFPHTTINNKRVCMRTLNVRRRNMINYPYSDKYQFATNKEIFEAKLKGEDNV